MNVTSRPQTANAAEDPVQDPPVAQDPLRRNITYMLIVAWLALVLGKAFGLVSGSYESDALLIGSVGVAFGYLYGRTVKTEEVRELIESPRTLSTPPVQEPR